MDWKTEWKPLSLIVGSFLLCFYLPVGVPRFDSAVFEALHLVKWYAREHVLLCLVPAFFIAGAITVFVSQASVMKYLGATANKLLAYGVASVSGTVLAVCSCTVLPLFSGIYRRGAGLGPASAFLYSGPAINVLAIIMTARILGLEIGIARAVGAISFSVIIGVLMHIMFRREEQEKIQGQVFMPEVEAGRPLWQTSLYFAFMVAILVFANWAAPQAKDGLWQTIYESKWIITSLAAAGFALTLIFWLKVAWQPVAVVAGITITAAFAFRHEPLVPFTVAALGLSTVSSRHDGEAGDWFFATWTFTKQMLPLLLAGVFVSGVLLGRPGNEGIIPNAWIAGLVGGNSLWANLFAAIVGAFMYFATLTEVPILQGLIGSGMGKGPALALLLAGPALSLPSMILICSKSLLGLKKGIAFIILVVILSTAAGMLYGTFF
jgi:hypothetical protein